MGLHSLGNISIGGMAACVPAKVFSTADYLFFSEQEKHDFTKYVGVRSRRYSTGKLTTSDLCYQASEKIIAQMDWNKEEIGLIVLVTQTPDYLMPASSILLQDKLKLRKSTIAFDINLGCSGWVFGLSVVGSLMRALKISKGLLLTGETSILSDYTDKTSFPLLGDAGIATAVIFSEAESSFFFNLQNDGRGFETLIAPDSGARYIAFQENGTRDIKYAARMNGQKLLEFCSNEIIPALELLLNFGNTKLEAVDYFVFHQANRIINESLRKKLGIPPEKFPYSINQFGNTSSASIPLTIISQLQSELTSKELLLLCCGFGVGLSWGSVIFETNRVVCPDLIEIE